MMASASQAKLLKPATLARERSMVRDAALAPSLESWFRSTPPIVHEHSRQESREQPGDQDPLHRPGNRRRGRFRGDREQEERDRGRAQCGSGEPRTLRPATAAPGEIGGEQAEPDEHAEGVEALDGSRRRDAVARRRGDEERGGRDRGVERCRAPRAGGPSAVRERERGAGSEAERRAVEPAPRSNRVGAQWNGETGAAVEQVHEPERRPEADPAERGEGRSQPLRTARRGPAARGLARGRVSPKRQNQPQSTCFSNRTLPQCQSRRGWRSRTAGRGSA